MDSRLLSDNESGIFLEIARGICQKATSLSHTFNRNFIRFGLSEKARFHAWRKSLPIGTFLQSSEFVSREQVVALIAPDQPARGGISIACRTLIRFRVRVLQILECP